MASAATVFVVDDDARCRDVVGAAARSLGLATAIFATAEEFIERYRDEPGCVAAALVLRSAGGVELLAELQRRGADIPVIVVAAQTNTAAVVRAMKAGAVTVLDKPLDEEPLRQAIRDAVALDAERRARRQEQIDSRTRLESLTVKEREVLRLLMEGLANKTMAVQLGASLRTIENRRRSVFTKLGVQSVAELVARVLKVDGGDFRF